MRHVILVVLAAAIAFGLTAVAQMHGAHDAPGSFVFVAGYPGLAAIGDLENDYQVKIIFTLVNWVFYFGLLESIWRLVIFVQRRDA
jgi:hypothetical protein